MNGLWRPQVPLSGSTVLCVTHAPPMLFYMTRLASRHCVRRGIDGCGVSDYQQAITVRKVLWFTLQHPTEDQMFIECFLASGHMDD